MIHFQNDAAATSAGGPVEGRPPYAPRKLIVQVSISLAATITPQVRLSPDLPWFSLPNITASGLTEYSAYPEIRFTYAGNTGQVTVATTFV